MSTDIAAQNPNAVAKKPVGSLLFKILLALIVIVGALAAYVSTKPNEFRVERSATIAASPEAVFEHVNDFRKWEAWSPWAKLDPKAKNSFEGMESGKGAVFKWDGNDKVGEGAMTIVDSVPPDHLQIRLDFEKPMKDTSTVDFTFQPVGDETKVTWAMSGRYQNFAGKAFCTLFNMQKMIGDKFDEGLAAMKKTVEGEGKSS
jgi:uncharacterized protein YndB with AHSA1/START domain